MTQGLATMTRWPPRLWPDEIRVSKPPKEQITLRLDADVLEWFRARGAGYQSRINALLRAHMNKHLRQQK